MSCGRDHTLTVRKHNANPIDLKTLVAEDRDCVASPTSRQNVSVNMRDFDLLQAACNGDKVHEQTRKAA